MEEFERFTEKSLLERGLKTLKDVDPILELSDDSDEDGEPQEKEPLLHAGLGTE